MEAGWKKMEAARSEQSPQKKAKIQDTDRKRKQAVRSEQSPQKKAEEQVEARKRMEEVWTIEESSKNYTTSPVVEIEVPKSLNPTIKDDIKDEAVETKETGKSVQIVENVEKVQPQKVESDESNNELEKLKRELTSKRKEVPPQTEPKTETSENDQSFLIAEVNHP